MCKWDYYTFRDNLTICDKWYPRFSEITWCPGDFWRYKFSYMYIFQPPNIIYASTSTSHQYLLLLSCANGSSLSPILFCWFVLVKLLARDPFTVSHIFKSHKWTDDNHISVYIIFKIRKCPIISKLDLLFFSLIAWLKFALFSKVFHLRY